MNTILFEQHELDSESRIRLSVGDKRVDHVRNVLRAVPGDRLSAGIVDGELGVAELENDSSDGMVFAFTPSAIDPSVGESAGAVPVAVLLGSVRPIVLRRLLRDLTSFGVDEILVARTELSERSYYHAKLWEAARLRAVLIEGAAQGGRTRLPRIGRYDSLPQALGNAERSRREDEVRIVLSFGSPSLPDAVTERSCARVMLAVGPERGFIERETALLGEHGFVAVGVPGGTLRTESAAIAGVAVARSVIRAND